MKKANSFLAITKALLLKVEPVFQTLLTAGFGMYFLYLFLCIGFKECAGTYESRPTRIVETDTIRKATAAPIVQAKPTDVPVKVIEYAKPDTAYRARVEKKKITTAVRTNREHIEIQTINPQGFTEVKQYELPGVELPELTIDSEGNMQVDEKSLKRLRRKRKWQKAGQYTAITLFFIAGVLIGSKASN
jgi:hypothetical protein